MEYNEFKETLYGFSDLKYQEFSSKLVNAPIPLVGIRIPTLKNLVKCHVNDDELNLSEFALDETVELTLCYFLLSLSRCKTYQEQIKFLDDNLQYACCWQITDSIPPYIKKNSSSEYFYTYKAFCTSSEVFKRRFSYIYAIKHARDPKIVEYLKYIKNDSEYYVMMGEAWFLATVYIYYPAEVYELLANTELDDVLKRKTISKICDSFRIPSENKEKVIILRKSH